jgi:hypothetical protein
MRLNGRGRMAAVDRHADVVESVVVREELSAKQVDPGIRSACSAAAGAADESRENSRRCAAGGQDHAAAIIITARPTVEILWLCPMFMHCCLSQPGARAL